MISGIFIPAGPLDQPSFTYFHRSSLNSQGIREYLNDGPLEGITLGKGQVMYADEDGRSKNLPLNGIATALYHRMRGGNMIVGNAVILGYDNEGETCSVSTDTLLAVARLATVMASTTGGFSEIA